MTDQGRQFESAVFNQVCQAMGMEKRRTCAYHPQSNGLVERAHQELKKLMRCLLVPVAEATRCDWESVLPHTLMAYNNAINDTGCSPKQLLFATDIVLPAGLVAPRAANGPKVLIHEYVSNLHHINALIRQHLYYERGPIRDFERSPPERVWLQVPVRKTSLENPFEGPYKVVAHQYPNITIAYKGGTRTVHITQVKPATTPRAQLEVGGHGRGDEERSMEDVDMQPSVILPRCVVPEPVPRLPRPVSERMYPQRVRRTVQRFPG